MKQLGNTADMKIPMTTGFQPGTVLKLRNLARQTNRSVSAIIREAVDAYLLSKEAKP